MFKLFKAACLMVLAAGMGACQKNFSAYALTSTGTLIRFDTKDPSKIVGEVSLSGLNSGQSLVQIDYRPADGSLYGITSDNELATLDPASGAVTVVSDTPFTTSTLASPAASWDPVNDQLRVITTQYNLRVNADGSLAATGTQTAFDSGDVNSAKTPQLVAISYNNHVANAASTTLYGLDLTTQSLVRVGDEGVSATSSVDAGVLHTLGSLGTSFGANAGINIEIANGTVYAALQQSGASAALYTIDTSTGAAASVGPIGSGDRTLIGLVIVPD
jgi:hypothetical protein